MKSKAEDLIVIDNPIVLARNLVEEGSEHKALLLQLEECDTKFRRHDPEVCKPKDFYRYARQVLGIFGEIIDNENRGVVDNIAQDMVSKNYQSDLFYKDVCGLCIYKIKDDVYTSCQIPKERNKWIEIACMNDGKRNMRPQILFPEHMEFYNSLSPRERALVHASHYYKGWKIFINSSRPRIARAAKKIERYERLNGVNLDTYAMQPLLGGKNGRK